MNNCTDLYFLSTIACKLSECLTEAEIELLSVNLRALGEMLEVITVRQAICKESQDTNSSQ